MTGEAPLYVLLAPLTAALLVALFTYFQHKWWKVKAAVTAMGLGLPGIILLYLYVTRSGLGQAYHMGGWGPDIGITLVVDELSLFLSTLIFLLTITGFIYSLSRNYAVRGRSGFYFFYLLMTMGLYGIVLTGDLFNLYVFFELTMVSSYVLITFTDTARAFRASFNYLVLGSAASMFFLLAIGLTYLYTGHFNMEMLADTFWRLPVENRTVIFVLLLGGVGLKSALFPFHLWLPDAHSSAPTPVSAVLSGVTVKAGVVIILRMFFVFRAVPSADTLLLALGCVTALVGAYFAMTQFDIKRVLAYHTVSQMGLIFIGIGLASGWGIGGALYHTMNHAVFKGLLFLTAGAIIYSTKTRDLREMAPCPPDSILLPVLVLGALSISGVPPFNGYFSKALLGAAAKGNLPVQLVLFFTTIGTVASFAKIIYYVLIKPKLSKQKVCKGMPVPIFMKLSLMVLAPLCILLGVLAPLVLEHLIVPAEQVITGATFSLYIPAMTPLSLAKDLAALLLGIPVAALIIRKSDAVERFLSRIHIDLNRATAAAVITLVCMLLFFGI